MTLAFDDCVLDLDRRQLCRATRTVAMTPQVFDLLVYLLEERARVVSRDDLFDAVWSGRIVSESTLASHINAVRKAIGDSGHAQRLVRTFARKGYRFIGEVTTVTESTTAAVGTNVSASADPTAIGHLDRPSIAVLPFVNLTGDPTQDYFADGVVEDIIAALSRFRWLFVIARNSSFTYKGRLVDVRQVGAELGVRYVLEGSVRNADGQVRITGQLIDATTRGHLWGDRFGGSVEHLFELQDRITESVVGAISPQLERAEILRAKNKPTGSLDSYDYYLRGMASFHQGSPGAITTALALFDTATQRDPDFAAAHAMMAWCYFWRSINGWMSDRVTEMEQGARLAERALELGRDDPIALTRAGHALAHFGGDLDRCIDLLDRSRALNPNLAATCFLGAYLRLWSGATAEAIEGFTHAMRISPLDPEMYRMQAGMAMAHLLAGRFDDATAWAERALYEMPDFLMVVSIAASAHANAGRAHEAGVAMRHLRRLDPDMRLSRIGDWLLLRRRADLELFVNGLAKAGLPA